MGVVETFAVLSIGVMGSILERIISRVRGLAGEAGRPRSDRLIYAVGDVHGRADLLEPLVEKILTDSLTEAGGDGEDRPPIVFVGDMIDRGPDSRGVLAFLLAMQDWPELELVLLGGNHEAMLFDFLHEPAANTGWLRHGGYETLQSYGLGRVGDTDSADDMRLLAADMAAAMGPHLDLLTTCQPSFRDGNLAFVHAAADPDLPIDGQPRQTLLWGCEAFAHKRRADGIWVVHGHEIVARPEVRRGRISIDTGAYATGRLTAMKIRGTDLAFLEENDGS